jgi:hypothetical protein
MIINIDNEMPDDKNLHPDRNFRFADYYDIVELEGEDARKFLDYDMASSIHNS